MPVKNAAQYLEQCMDSIVHQSYGNWELIAVDDGSTDNSMEILENYERYNPRIKVLESTEGGIIPALQMAFEHSSGEFITRMDADDVMPTRKLEQLFDAIEGEPKKTVVTGKVRYFSDKKVSEGYKRYESWLNTVVEDESFRENLYRECVIASPNWMVHRSCFEDDFAISSLEYPEDYDMVFKWFDHGYEFKSVNSVTHLWREHPERTSRNSENYQQKAFFELKTKRFIQHFNDQIQGVQVIGAGEKGKLVSEILSRNNVSFQWYDLSPKREDIQSVMALNKQLTILSNWPADERIQEDITKFLRKMNLKFGQELWLF
ncbi:MAG: glycosyltransferase family 2 protein [Crocinitomicaceae bacterium]|nr:glycosyltransferase family 2 protein [Crocinitomicaceae bacterium]